MRAELPWNVAGIPPEAREAARAAARREGLSVGEWLTRRILRSFSNMDDDFAPPLSVFEPRPAAGPAALDSWGLPPSAAARRETEDMMARVGRSETESNDAWRRIEDQLRGLSRRLDSSERSHSESNRTLSRTTQEMNIAAREQSQAFDQLGVNVMALHERLERLERAAASDGTREAVKALHQGLSRLADQISATANNSASQVTQLTANLEQLAGRVGQARLESENADKVLERRLHDTEQRLEGRIAAAERAAQQFNTTALDQALEKLEASANQRAADRVESQHRHGQAEESINRLEDAIARLEMRLPDAAYERRLDGIEQTVTGMAQRLEGYDPAERFDDAMRELTERLEALEKDHAGLAADTQARAAKPPPAYSAEPPPALEPPPAFAPYEAPKTTVEPPHFTFDPPPPSATPFTSEFGPDFDALFAQPQAEVQAENFLAQARRSARAASERAESERNGRLGGFRWKDNAEEPAAPKRRFSVPLVLALLVVLVAGAGLVLMQNPQLRNLLPLPQLALPQMAAPQTVVPAVPEAPAPQAANKAPAQPALVLATPEPPAAKPAPAAASTAPQPERHGAPVKLAPARDASAADRVARLAKQGNAAALTILGLRALDGGDGQPVNLPDAVKYLTAAAQKGQPVAQYRLGTLYERGQGVSADGVQAAHWYALAAGQGNRKAMHNLAVAYAGGTGGKRDMAEAARWFAKAASLGLSDSQFNLAVLYERGDGVPQSLSDAFKWYSIAAAAGDQESKQRIAALQTQLPDSDKAAGAHAAATFRATPLDRAANVPPDPVDLGR